MSAGSHSRYLIIGAGSMGLAAAHYLAQRTDETIQVLDAYSPPHEHGAHHGETRLIRLAYGEGAAYVPLAKQAWALWQAMGQAAEQDLLMPVGVLNAGPSDDPFVVQVQASADQYQLALDTLPGDTVNARWAGWQLPPRMTGCFEAQAGVLRIDRIMRWLRQQVRRHAQLQLFTGAGVVRLEPLDSGGVRAHCADGRQFSGDRVLLSTGQSLQPLMARLGVNLPLTRVRKTFAWFECDERYTPERFPGFSITDASGIYYGFPDIDGAGFKIGRHDGGQPLAPGAPLRSFGELDEDLTELQPVLDRYFPGVGALRHGAVCQYIRTPDEHFLIDECLPGVLVAGGFSGHGYKFASVLGDLFADWLAGEEKSPLLAPFSAQRF